MAKLQSRSDALSAVNCLIMAAVAEEHSLTSWGVGAIAGGASEAERPHTQAA